MTIGERAGRRARNVPVLGDVILLTLGKNAHFIKIKRNGLESMVKVTEKEILAIDRAIAMEFISGSVTPTLGRANGN